MNRIIDRMYKIANEETDDEFTIEEIFNEIKSSIKYMKENVNLWAIRDTLKKFTEWGFYNGSVMAVIDEKMASDICDQLMQYVDSCYRRKDTNSLDEIYDKIYFYARPNE